ncbi:hypothetical protein V5O48_012729 [Marasmius crinis-equi]|uniref:galacturonan 1,4-alpha-galacturonidase n=1 Tax=Marasmius crinis-equi TaxID=585013 RepID=A0ABR3F213_9AGAR
MRTTCLILSWIVGINAWNTFTVPHTGVAGQDDTPGLTAALANFSTNATILFQKGVTYNIFTPITFPVLQNVEVRIEGNLSLPSDIPTVQAIVGDSWWDAQNQVNRPHGWRFAKIDGGVIRDMKIWKPVAWNFATSGSNNIHAFNNRIVAVSDTNVSYLMLEA